LVPTQNTIASTLKSSRSVDILMQIAPVRNHEDYRLALARIGELLDARPNTPEADELELLAALVKAYEDKHFEIPLPDPIEAILYYIEAKGLSRQDLEPIIGSRSRVSEILNRKRPLTLPMIRRLSEGIGIPAHVLIQDYEPAAPPAESLTSYADAYLLYALARRASRDSDHAYALSFPEEGQLAAWQSDLRFASRDLASDQAHSLRAAVAKSILFLLTDKPHSATISSFLEVPQTVAHDSFTRVLSNTSEWNSRTLVQELP